VVKRAFAFLEFCWHGPVERLPLLVAEHFTDGGHIPSQAGNWQEVPAVASRDIVHAAIVDGAVVQSDPAREMGHRTGTRPIRIVLVPSHDAAMSSRLAEQLIMPEADGTTYQLAGRDTERWVPQDVVKTDSNSPST
jgi:hypothetical protein